MEADELGGGGGVFVGMVVGGVVTGKDGGGGSGVGEPLGGGVEAEVWGQRQRQRHVGKRRTCRELASGPSGR